jgi:NADH:ubiquinone oxidoreductase subunit 5 (subunit L)/multisubunit Na+/H+ antiporter MnhA subunit/multisubunit Na+/H+ antiporter MnhB subunit
MDTPLLVLLLTPFLLALFLPVAGRKLGPKTGWLALLGPAIAFAAVLSIQLSPAETRLPVEWPWLPSLGAALTFDPDGLALFFGFVVTGIGILVTLYAASYLDGHYRDHGKFYCYLMLFMGAMLLTVFSSNLLVLFVAWELTGLTSFLLIGFLHEKHDSQRGARMALLTTGATGLALLAGVVLLWTVFGTFELGSIIGAAVPAGKESLLLAAFLCCFTGIAGKSAQFPFHYWLPNAMAAPTPVSAYLHSATMVKLGVFLTARLLPVFNGLESWTPVLTVIGFGTLLLGAVLALLSQDLKGVLAYTTVAQLGLLIGFYGLHARGVPVTWDYLHIANHVFYKACLFMVVGIVDHAAGTRDQCELGGLFRAMPLTGIAAVIGAAVLAGLPPTTGFLSKELLLKSVFVFREAGHGFMAWWPVVTVVLASVIKVTVAAGFIHRVFFGRMPEKIATHFHAPSFGLQVSPLLLAFAALGGGLFAADFGRSSLSFGVTGTHALAADALHLWHGFTPELLTSAAIILAGLALYFSVGSARWSHVSIPRGWQLDILFDKLADGILYAARKLNRALGFEKPQVFLFATAGAMVATVLTGFILTREAWWSLPAQWALLPRAGAGWLRWAVVLIVGTAAIAAVVWQKPIRQLLALSMAGLGITGYFVLYHAPDLALTQMLVETITLLLVLLVVLRLKRHGADQESMRPQSSWMKTLRIACSAGLGLILGGSVLFFQQADRGGRAGDFYLQNTVPLAKGTNAVNTVVIDFRGWDTFGEIVVLLVAAMGVLGLLARRRRGGRRLEPGGGEDLFPVPPDSILRAVAIGAFLPLNAFAVHLFFRGHNLPGGGFVAGLVTALSLLLLVFAIGVHGVRRQLRFNPLTLAIFGVALALGTVLLPVLQGLPLLNSLHAYAGSFYLGSPVFFDLGVFCTVVGVTLKLILPLMKSVHGLSAFVREEEGAFMSTKDEPIDLGSDARSGNEKGGRA